jgi:hypothetical protein
MRGATNGALVQLNEPPFHRRTVGLPAASATPTAQPSESLTMKTESSSRVLGDVVVLHIALEAELQLFRQKATTPDLPTDQMFPPDVANVTESSPRVVATWLTGSLLQVGVESRDVPCRTVAPFASASPTAYASDELSSTMDLRIFVVVPALTGPVQVFPSVVWIMVPPSPTAQPFVVEDIATPFRLTPATGLARAVQTPPTNLKIVPAFPTAIPSSPEQGEPEQ